MKLEAIETEGPADGHQAALDAVGEGTEPVADGDELYLNRYRVVGVDAAPELVVYRTITAECGHSADIWSWDPWFLAEDKRLNALLDALRELGFRAVDVSVDADDSVTLDALGRGGFTRMRSAYVFMPLQSVECMRTLKRAGTLGPEFRFRWAGASDVPTIVRMLGELIVLADVRRGEDELTQLVRERMAQPSWSGGYLLVEESGAAVGVTNLYLTAEREALIFDLIVRESNRGGGIGSAVWGQIGGQLQKVGFEQVAGEVDIANPAALKFWLRTLGGSVDEERVSMTRSL